MALENPHAGALDGEITFERLLNFRDVGQTVNVAAGDEILKPGRLYRSSRPDECTASDRDKLTSTLDLRTVVDLRTDTELVHRASQRDDADAALPPPEPLPGVIYHRINLNGRGYRNAVVAQLSWAAYLRLIALYLGGYRVAMMRLIAAEVLTPRGLVGLALDTLAASGEELRALFTVLADAESYPVLLHCTQGKDRTGVTVLLALMLLGCPPAAIEDDYRRSDEGLRPELAGRLAELAEIGLGEDYARTAPDFVERVTVEVNDRYGGIREYLRSIGVDDEVQDRVKTLLTS